MDSAIGKRMIILDGLPGNVVPAKKDMFHKHLTKQLIKVLGHENFTITLLTDDESGLVSGAFVTCSKEADAEAALAKLNLFPLTKSDILKTYRWSALQNAKEEDKPYVAPATENTAEEDMDFTHTLAEDPNAFPQYIVKGGNQFECDWLSYNWETNTESRCKVEKNDLFRLWSELDRKKRKLQNGLVSSLLPQVSPLPVWSTYGHMLISQTLTGLNVWGGKSMQHLYAIPEDVTAFMVSPREQYIVIQTEKDISIMNARTARKIQTLGNLDLSSDDLWPIFRFSADDSLVAVCKPGVYRGMDTTTVAAGKMYIYKSETMSLLQGTYEAPRSHTFEIDGLYKAEWNPQRGTQIAYASASGKNLGWQVTISEIVLDESNVASEVLQCNRRFANAEGLEILWHPAGTYLAVKVINKKSTEYSLFHMGRDVATFQMQVKQDYSPQRFAWQPGGDMFAVILSSDAPGARLGDTSILQVYVVKDRKKLKLIAEYPTATTRLFWAPKGRCLCAINEDKSLLSFVNINEHDVAVEKKVSCQMTNVQWDPTGRFFATWISSLGEREGEGGYKIFTFNGDVCYEKRMKPFSHFSWRPLPPTLLTEAEIKKIRDPQNIRKLLSDYDDVIQELEEKKKAAIAKQNKEYDNAYIKRMNEIARKAESAGYEEEREELYGKSRWSQYWRKRIQAMPEDARRINELVVEEKEIYRRELAQGAKK